MSATPQFIITGYAAVTVSQLNSAIDGSGSFDDVLTAGANGAELRGLWIKAQGTTQVCFLNIFYNDTSDSFLIDQIEIPQIVPTVQVKSYSTYWPYPATKNPLVATHKIQVAIQSLTAQSLTIIPDGGDY